MPLAFESLTLITPQSGQEQLAGQEALLSPRSLQAYSKLQRPLAQRLHAAVGRLLRWSAHGLYLAPLLLLPKAALRVFGQPGELLAGGDLLTVFFLGLVLLFFGLLACWILLFFLVGPRSSRVARRTPWPLGSQLREALHRLGYRTPQRPTPASQLRALCQRRRPHFRKRLFIRGRVVPCSDGEKRPLLCDAWLQQEDHAARWLCAESFAVLADDCPPVVLRFASAPLVLGPRGSAPPKELEPRLADWLAEQQTPLAAADLAAQPGISIAAGDQIELIASGGEVIEDLDQLMLDGRPLQLPTAEGPGAGPYRQPQRRQGLLLTSRPASPIILRLC